MINHIRQFFGTVAFLIACLLRWIYENTIMFLFEKIRRKKNDRMDKAKL